MRRERGLFPQKEREKRVKTEKFGRTREKEGKLSKIKLSFQIKRLFIIFEGETIFFPPNPPPKYNLDLPPLSPSFLNTPFKVL